jgi:hypothetical protein
MLTLNTQKIRRMRLYASLIGIIGFGASILCGNEDGFIMRVPVLQTKALLLCASALPIRALYIRVCDLGFRKNRQRQIGTPISQPDSLTGLVGEKNLPEQTDRADHTTRPAQEAN